ncbi:MAG: universal stress protein [Candidatus Binatia bacterium]
MSEVLRIAKVLVPVDGSECSRYAAEHAARIAAACGAELIFLHVVDEAVVDALGHRTIDNGQRVREQLRENGHMYVRDIARLAIEHNVVHQEEIADGDPCAVICAAAIRHDVDLIVMGKIGRRGARRILVGSVTQRVTEFADRPVLIITGPPAVLDKARMGG